MLKWKFNVITLHAIASDRAVAKYGWQPFGLTSSILLTKVYD